MESNYLNIKEQSDSWKLHIMSTLKVNLYSIITIFIHLHNKSLKLFPNYFKNKKHIMIKDIKLINIFMIKSEFVSMWHHLIMPKIEFI